MPTPSNNASAATKLKWLKQEGWEPFTRTVQGQYQVTSTHAKTAQQRVFCGATYPKAVGEAFESLAEHPDPAATRGGWAL